MNGEAKPVKLIGGVSRETWILAGLLAFPSIDFVRKYGGFPGLVAYGVMVVAVMLWFARFGRRLKPWLDRHFRILATPAILGLALGFVVLHPIEDKRGPGKSSDRNEGLELAVTRMVEGKYPYYPPREFPGPLSVLPGSIVLSAPFAVLGNSGYQNIFWLGAFLIASAGWFRDRALALGLLVIPLALSPAAQYEFVSGGDLISNGIFTCLFGLFALRTWSIPNTAVWKKCLACVLLGIGLASRANFILLTPLFGATLWQVAGPRRAIAASALVGLTTIAICLPFYLHDPAGFTPLGSSRKLGLVNDTLPWAGAAMIGLTAAVALAGAITLLIRHHEQPITNFFRWCVWVTLTPLVLAILLSSWVHESADFRVLHDRFGLMYVFFALLGWGGSWISPDKFVSKVRNST